MLRLFLPLDHSPEVKLYYCIGFVVFFSCFYISAYAQIHRAVGRYTDEKNISRQNLFLLLSFNFLLCMQEQRTVLTKRFSRPLQVSVGNKWCDRGTPLN